MSNQKNKKKKDTKSELRDWKSGRHKDCKQQECVVYKQTIKSENVGKQSMLFSLRTSETIMFCSLHATGYLRPGV